MVQIKPFTGLRYSEDKIPDYTNVTAPPYDVISSEEQKALYDKHPNNVVRLILGLKNEGDNDTNNVYTRAHEMLEEWRKTGVMNSEKQPAFYAYSQTWEGIERRGFIGLLKLETYESGQVLPHEFTLGGPKADRLALTKATGTILSPIFCLYHDPAQTMEALLFKCTQDKAIEVKDQDGVVHKFWPVYDEAITQQLQQLLADKPVLIADGHHRYETACAHQTWRRETMNDKSELGSQPWDYTMAFFTNMADSGLRIYPTHRVLVSLPNNLTTEKLLEGFTTYFEPAEENHALFWLQEPGGAKKPYQLRAGIDTSMIPEPLRNLDVALIDQFVFKQIFNHTADELKQAGHLLFVRDEHEVVDRLKAGALVFWVHAPSVEETRIVCESGYRMPQKSTYFYPKLLSGLVMHYYGPAVPASVS